MQTEALNQLIQTIQKQKSETQTLELKAAADGCPTRLFDTLSAFSNQDDGGIIVFGVDERAGFKVVGVYDAQDLQKKVTEQCKQMEPAVRALFTVCEVDGKLVVSAEIPSVDISDRPVFYKGVGRIKGSYIRVGEADELMSEYEIYSYDAFRKRIRDDLRPVEKANFSLFDQSRLAEYLDTVKRERKNLADNCTDEEILELMGVAQNGIPTLAGVLTFCKYPQAYFPQLCITAVAIPGTEMGELGDAGERFLDNVRITGAIPDMVEEAVAFVRRNCRTKTIIDTEGKRQDRVEYPLKAVREIILNALVHRDYSIHTENVPVRLELYRNRMEVISSGGLYGKITLDSLGKVRPDTRNAALANMLELLKVTENRYSGIPTVRMELQKAGLPAPEFSVVHGEFRVVFHNSQAAGAITSESTRTPQAILEFCSSPRSRTELLAFIGTTRSYAMRTFVQPLIDSGKLRLTMPEKPKSPYQQYVRSDI